MKMLHERIRDIDFCFETNRDCFSPEAVDKGTLAMLSIMEFKQGNKVLDLGCGYGVVGIFAAKFTVPQNVFMLDVNEQVLVCARSNIMRNQVEGVEVLCSDAYDALNAKDFDYILSNPPYHTDFSVPKKFIEKGFNRLKVGGKLVMVTKRKDWYKNKLTAVFGGVKIFEIDGYYVFQSEKKSLNRKDIKQKKEK